MDTIDCAHPPAPLSPELITELCMGATKGTVPYPPGAGFGTVDEVGRQWGLSGNHTSLIDAHEGTITITADASWLSGIEWLRSLVGGLMLATLTLLVIALVVGVVRLVSAKTGMNLIPGQDKISGSHIVIVLIAAALAGSLTYLVGWSAGLDMGVGSFTIR